MRDRIVSEIKQLVADNGGKVPGIRAFELATGIHRREWMGKIWARWSDALTEAGYEPNTLIQRLDSNFVLEQVAQACLDLGCLPTNNDLRLYQRSHSDFPSTTTIENHFPRRNILVEALRTWAADRHQFSRVLAMLPDRKAHAELEVPSPGNGYVYLIKSGDFYKIGRSDQIEQRVKQIRVALPQASTLEHTILTDDPPGIEGYWHRRFADRRANGEWFKLSRADILAFKRRRFQ